MRKPKRPFLVEVKRGGKRPAGAALAPSVAPPVPFDPQADAARRAEAALFRAPGGAPPAPESNRVTGRVLEAIAPVEELTPDLFEPELEPKRRGRKPGSKNRTPDEIAAAADAPKRRRGRPPRRGEAGRSLPMTPELASAALDAIARLPGAGRPRVAGAPSRKPGRPPASSRPSAPAWMAWAASGDDEPAFAPAAPVAAGPAPALTLRRRAARAHKPGERWMRRLRTRFVRRKARAPRSGAAG